jgi:uncharacterized membrane protein (DUF4010 family)
MNAGLTPLELAERLALVLGLAIFLGLAFEDVYKRDERARPGGVRTFPILALTGAMLYLIEPRYALAFVAGLLALGLWLHTFLRRAEPSDERASSLMIPASNLLAYAIGPIALFEPPWVAVAVSVAAVLLLGTREKMHRLVRILPGEELLTAGKFLVLVGIILPLVPNRPVTDLTPLTPYQLWLAVVAVCGVSYASYLLQRYAPTKDGKGLLPAVLGGIYSSTTTTVVLAKRQRDVGAARSDLAAGIAIATSIMYLRLGVIIAIFNLRLAWALAPALAGLFAVGAALALYEWRRIARRPAGAGLAVPAVNPLEVPTALIFAALFVAISVLSAWVGAVFGQTGVLSLAAIVGFTDIDPFVLSIAQGGLPTVPTAVLCAAIIVAASSNNVLKAAYAVVFGGFASSRRPAAMLVLLAVLGFLAAAAYVV